MNMPKICGGAKTGDVSSLNTKNVQWEMSSRLKLENFADSRIRRISPSGVMSTAIRWFNVPKLEMNFRKVVQSEFLGLNLSETVNTTIQ